MTGNDDRGSQTHLKYAYRELFEPRLIAVSLCISFIFVLFFTVAGPGSEILKMPLWRAAYFGSIAALTWPLGHSMAVLLLYYLRSCRTYNFVLASLAGGLYTAANIATIGYAMHMLMVPDSSATIGWPMYYLRAAVASVVHFGLIYYLAYQRARLRPLVRGADDSGNAAAHAGDAGDAGTAQVPPAAAEPPQPQARFLGRLPAELGRDVVYLKVNGHYINVVTTAGSSALLMRFADAVAELGDAGMQVHRSFWVAYRHVAAVLRRDERTVVRLTGGEEVPVSRTFVAAVRKLAVSEMT